MPIESGKDKRHFQRILYSAEGTLTENTTTYPCRVVDISLKGCLLEFLEPWANSIDGFYLLTINLTEEVSISMELRFAHSDGTQAGFKCEHIDIDSMTTLRRLVELNLGNSELLERDLMSLSSL
ncbi:MAG: PilZ domain-containing protein [Gammaproteobacteria bacterium]